MEPPKLTRDDILKILTELHITIPKETLLKTDRLRHRLERCLDAAQRYSTILGDESRTVDPSEYPLWDGEGELDLEKGMRRCVIGGHGGLINPEEIPQEETFDNVCWMLINMARAAREGTREFIFSDQKEYGIILEILSIHEIAETRPLISLVYAPILKIKSDPDYHFAIRRFFRARIATVRTFNASKVEQALFLQLLKQNTNHLSPKFKPPSRVDKRYTPSFVLPTTWLNMTDQGRLSKTTGCAICGSPTQSYCSGCNSVQYCSKDCQRRHWKAHKVECQSNLSSGKIWHTIRLMATSDDYMNKYNTWFSNRFDDLSCEVVTKTKEERAIPPPNLYDDNYHIIKIQAPYNNPMNPRVLIYDRQKSFQLFFRTEMNPTAYQDMLDQMGSWPKIYRWVK